MNTVAHLLDEAAQRLAAAGIEDSHLEAELLLGHVTHASRSAVLARYPEPVDPAAFAAFDALLARRIAREPLAYIVGHREFYGTEIACAHGALIPRPETELLVEFALREARSRGAAPWIADVGTGSGAVSIAIAAHAPSARVVATDRSDAALAVAMANIAHNGLSSRVHALRTDLLVGTGAFDIVVANLPYVSDCQWSALAPEIRDHEPESALRGGPTGTDVTVRLLRQAPYHLRAGGSLAMEFGAGQTELVLAAARCAFPAAEHRILRDAGNNDRVLVVETEREDVGWLAKRSTRS